jgi:preprotein translocase subunit SecA
MASDKSLIKKYGKIADQIIALEPEMQKLTDEDFLLKTQKFQKYLQEDDSHEVEDILVEAYAVAREASKRVLGLNAFRVQLIGAIILNNGDIAQMRTGEGKTLTGIFPAYLNALSGKGVHVVTVNEYLSRRDAEINGTVYSLLGLTVGINGNGLSKIQKRNAYNADITYTTNSELGFDYLKDNMVMSFADKVQRGLNYAIIDEADSILIDESRTPLIISGGSTSMAKLYQQTDTFAKTLKVPDDVEIDLESKQVYLTEQGMKKAKEYFSVENLFDLANTELFHLILNALKANFTFKEGVEYSVKDGEIKLIDQFTGRIMEGRAYSDGLQQSIQAKEGVRIEEESETLATITYQNFYRLYAKLSGMTGTAKTEEEEFIKIYNTRVIVVPTNKPMIRKDEVDLTFATKNAALK